MKYGLMNFVTEIIGIKLVHNRLHYEKIILKKKNISKILVEDI
jgi:hypothetical protein